MGPLLAVAMFVAALVSVSRGKYDTLYISVPLGLLAAVAGVVGFVFRHRDVVLWRDGAACKGVVVRSWTSKSRNAGDSHWVEYRYDVEGQSFGGMHQMSWCLEDKEIWVLYDPARPERSIPQHC